MRPSPASQHRSPSPRPVSAPRDTRHGLHDLRRARQQTSAAITRTRKHSPPPRQTRQCDTALDSDSRPTGIRSLHSSFSAVEDIPSPQCHCRNPSASPSRPPILLLFHFHRLPDASVTNRIIYIIRLSGGHLPDFAAQVSKPRTKVGHTKVASPLRPAVLLASPRLRSSGPRRDATRFAQHDATDCPSSNSATNQHSLLQRRTDRLCVSLSSPANQCKPRSRTAQVEGSREQTRRGVKGTIFTRVRHSQRRCLGCVAVVKL